jgi:hypothetical protein
MVEKTGDVDRLDWRPLLYAVLGTFIAFVLAAFCERDLSVILYIVVVAPIISVILLNDAIRKRGRKRLSILAIVAIYWAVSAALIGNYSAVRDSARWFVWSHDFKPKVLTQPASANRGFRHVEWDGWGWAGMDTTVYLVFDPSDSLSAAAKSPKPGRYNGIPCEVFRVRRLQSNWYAVQFYTDEHWDARNALDCTTGSEH